MASFGPMIPFTGNPLDRASEKRSDRDWLATRRADPSSLILPLWRLEPFLTGPEEAPELGFLRPGLAERLAPEGAAVFLGLEKERALFALDISAAEDPASALGGMGRFVEARAAAMQLSGGDAAILGQAKSMLDWHRRHGFCANCGARTEAEDGGYKRVCGACGAEHFPRTDPVVIMLALHGEACLVGRGRNFPRGRFSALAGFVEPGETIEEAVRRELREEAGVVAGEVTYRISQPWPFPSSLMIGCFAQVKGRDLILDESEIAEARWLERDEVRAAFNGQAVDGVILPPPIAIAHHLLKAWVGL